MTKCTNCKYEWETKSKMKFVTCPSCLTKVEVSKPKKAESPNANRSEENNEKVK